MTAGPRPPLRVDLLADRLGEDARGRAILADLARVRVLTGAQLDALHFPGGGGDGQSAGLESWSRVRRRVMDRLAELGAVVTLDRRIGGVRAGSAGNVYALSVTGQRVLPVLGITSDRSRQIRTPATPGERFLAHSLDVSALYVALRVAERNRQVIVGDYLTEPACWFSAGYGGVLKPDSYTHLRRHGADVADSWWIEVDRATTSLPTLHRKLLSYVDYADTGGLGPAGVMPRVLVTTPHPRRREDVTELIRRLPHPADRLITSVLHPDAVTELVRHLHT